MRQIRSVFLVAVAFSVLAMVGCSEEEVNNEASVVFWYGQSVSEELLAAEVLELKLYVDGQQIGTYEPDFYWTSSPDCGDNGSVTVTKQLGSSIKKDFSYRIVDDTDFEIWSGTVTFDALACTAIELTQ